MVGCLFVVWLACGRFRWSLRLLGVALTRVSGEGEYLNGLAASSFAVLDGLYHDCLLVHAVVSSSTVFIHDDVSFYCPPDRGRGTGSYNI